MTIYYKLRHKETGLYVKGTPYYLSYDGTGRIFQKLGSLRSFLTGAMQVEHRKSQIPNWEVVELEMVVKEVKDVHKVIKPEKLMKILKDI